MQRPTQKVKWNLKKEMCAGAWQISLGKKGLFW